LGSTRGGTTVDPERDTPDILKAYLENFDSRIIGLTGDPSKTEAIAKAFRVYAKKVPGEKSGDSACVRVRAENPSGCFG